jgi:hypothetical protein
MYSTDDADDDEAGDFMRDQEPEDREPRPGSAPVPGHRPSLSGSTPHNIPTEADDDAHSDHAGRRGTVRHREHADSG